MKNKFKVGQQVVCINGHKANTPMSDQEYEHMETLNRDHWIIQDKLYIIRHIEIDDQGVIWIGLEGIPNIVYTSDNFRPIKLDHDFVNLLLNNL